MKDELRKENVLSDTPDKPRRSFLFLVTGVVVAFGAAAATVPLFGHLSPVDDRCRNFGLNVDLSKLKEGEQMHVLYRGRLFGIRHRTPAEIKSAQAGDSADLPHKETDRSRLRQKPNGKVDPRFLVFSMKCDYFGNVPISEAGDFGGWCCPSNGAHFDTSGRIRKGATSTNMKTPNYIWTSDSSISIL